MELCSTNNNYRLRLRDVVFMKILVTTFTKPALVQNIL